MSTAKILKSRHATLLSDDSSENEDDEVIENEIPTVSFDQKSPAENEGYLSCLFHII